MYAFRTLYRLAVAKKVKINYFVVDARTGRGIDRSLDRIKSRAIPFTFSTCLPSIFFLCSFFFFLPLSLSLPLLFFSHFQFYRDRYQRASVLLFLDTVDDTQRKMITLFVVWGKRGGGRAGSWRTKFFFRCLPVEKKGFISTLRRKSRRFEDSKVGLK